MDPTEGMAFDYATGRIGQSRIIHADCLEWLSRLSENALHTIVTDPPYGVKEYDLDQLEKRANGKGGIWRIPPSFDGHTRAPLPRFTALNRSERKRLARFFFDWGKLAVMRFDRVPMSSLQPTPLFPNYCTRPLSIADWNFEGK